MLTLEPERQKKICFSTAPKFPCELDTPAHLPYFCSSEIWHSSAKAQCWCQLLIITKALSMSCSAQNSPASLPHQPRPANQPGTVQHFAGESKEDIFPFSPRLSGPPPGPQSWCAAYQKAAASHVISACQFLPEQSCFWAVNRFEAPTSDSA